LIGSEFVFTAHIDETTCYKENYQGEIEKCLASSASMGRLYLMGAYDEEYSDCLNTVFQAFEPYLEKIQLMLCCCGRVNMELNGFPKSRSLIVDVMTGIPYPFTFQNRGPEILRRLAYLAVDSEEDGLTSIVDLDGILTLSSFEVELGEDTVYSSRAMIGMAERDEKLFLELSSTSPLHESDMFIPDIVGKMKYLLDHDHQIIDVVRYSFTESGWQKID
jgi:hypothetical protein